MNSIDEAISLESFPPLGLSLETIAGDAYLKIDSAEFGYVEYKASTLNRRLKERRAAMLSELQDLRPPRAKSPPRTRRTELLSLATGSRDFRNEPNNAEPGVECR